MSKCFILFISLLLYSCNKMGFKKNILINDYNTPIVELKVNNSNYNFIIDTGSEKSFINKKIVESNITDSVYISTLNFDGITDDKKSYIVKILINDSIDVNMLTIDINSIQENIFIKSGIIVDGIIGSDILSKYNAIIDYKNNKLILN